MMKLKITTKLTFTWNVLLVHAITYCSVTGIYLFIPWIVLSFLSRVHNLLYQISLSSQFIGI